MCHKAPTYQTGVINSITCTHCVPQSYHFKVLAIGASQITPESYLLTPSPHIYIRSDISICSLHNIISIVLKQTILWTITTVLLQYSRFNTTNFPPNLRYVMTWHNLFTVCYISVVLILWISCNTESCSILHGSVALWIPFIKTIKWINIL